MTGPVVEFKSHGGDGVNEVDAGDPCLVPSRSTGIPARLASIDLIDTVATVRLELENWTGHRFTDLFTVLKVDGDWKIMNKVFHLHPANVESEAA